MRKVTLIMTASIDGFVVKPDGLPVGATPEPDELKRWKLDRISRAGTHVMGRVTYQQMASVWPTSGDPYAAPMNAIPKVVFSRTLARAEWPESSIASGEPEEELAKLRAMRGGEIIVWGGAALVQSFTRANLIDEYAIITNPIAYGGGKPMFADLQEARVFELLATTSFASGHLLRLLEPRRKVDP